jgi:hypothetical protein
VLGVTEKITGLSQAGRPEKGKSQEKHEPFSGDESPREKHSEFAHCESPEVFANFPRAQPWQTVAPDPEEMEPAAHGVQTDAPLVLEKSPGEHGAHVELEFAATAEDEDPGLHNVQVDEFEAAAYRPAVQLLHTEAPVSENVPGAHETHAAREVALAVLDAVPAEQLVHEPDGGSVEKEPNGHGRHEVMPGPSVYPPAHTLHCKAWPDDEMEPVGHGAHSFPSGLNVPGWHSAHSDRKSPPEPGRHARLITNASLPPTDWRPRRVLLKVPASASVKGPSEANTSEVGESLLSELPKNAVQS